MVRDKRSSDLTTALTTAEARAHLSQAHEYLRAAQFSLDNHDWNAAVGIAVLAGINAADAVAGFGIGLRWSGAHEQAAAHVTRAGTDGRAVAAQIRKLVRVKNLGQYEAKPARSAEAADMVQAAERAVATADRAQGRLDS